jgi:hypothetical protein
MSIPQKKLIPAILFALMVAALAAPPLWWSECNPPVLNANPANNKGPANIGQAKHMAKSALDALYPILPATAAAIEADLVGAGNPIPSWAAPANQAEKDKNHAPLLIGQLKAIVDPFYTHLHAAVPAWLGAERTENGTNHPNSIFPWTAETTDDANKAIANIGQLKAVFSLRFDSLPQTPLDSDGDGLPDAWEIAHGLNPQDATGINGPDGDPDGDGHSNIQEYNSGSNPQSANDPLPPRTLTMAVIRLARDLPEKSDLQVNALTNNGGVLLSGMSGTFHAYRWRAGTRTELASPATLASALPGTVSVTSNSAVDMNESGAVVGTVVCSNPEEVVKVPAMFKRA